MKLNSVFDLKKSKLTNPEIVKQYNVCQANCRFFFSVYNICMKRIYSILPWVCSAKDYGRHQNVVKSSLTHSPLAHVSLLVLSRRMAMCNLFVNQIVRVDLMSGQVCMVVKYHCCVDRHINMHKIACILIRILGCFLNFVWSLGFKRIIHETRDLAPFLVNLKACSNMSIFYYNYIYLFMHCLKKYEM